MEANLSWNWHELHDAFFSEEQYVTIAATRGGGKTRGAFLWIVEELLDQELSGLWMDVKHSNIDAYIEENLHRTILKDCWSLFKYDKPYKKLSFPNGSYIQFASAEIPKNAEGFRYHRVVLNEGGLILKKASLWDNTLEPMTHPRDGIANKTRIIGTPKGKNKFHMLHLMEDWGHYNFPITECAQYSSVEVEKFKKNIPSAVWRQEYMAEFLDDAGSVFRNISANIKGVKLEAPEANHRYVMGVDLAKHQDFTVIMIADKEDGRVVYIDRFNQIDWVFQKRRIIEAWNRFNKPALVIDSTGVGDSIFDDLRMAGVAIEGYKFTAGSKNELIQNLAVAMDGHQVSYYNDETLINELQIFAYDMTPSGNIRYNAPEGFHDDCVIALALVNYKLGRSIDLPILSL